MVFTVFCTCLVCCFGLLKLLECWVVECLVADLWYWFVITCCVECFKLCFLFWIVSFYDWLFNSRCLMCFCDCSTISEIFGCELVFALLFSVVLCCLLALLCVCLICRFIVLLF